ncbi:hypothetical protein G9A89_010312 [Geosiphon pyriformis]|nr:hypothetical protein G9A89_010312 [Geosiphon pyriformis]
MKTNSTSETILAPRPRKSVRLIASSIASTLERRCQSTPTQLPVRYRNPIVHHPFLPEPARPSSLSTTFSTKTLETSATSMEELVKGMKRNGILSGPDNNQKENYDWTAHMDLEDVFELEENSKGFTQDFEDESDAYAEFLEIIANVTHAPQTYQSGTYINVAPLNSRQNNNHETANAIKSLSGHDRSISFEINENGWPSSEIHESNGNNYLNGVEPGSLKLMIPISQTTGPFLQASPICRTQNPMPLNSPFLGRQNRNGAHNRIPQHRHSLPKPKKQMVASLSLPIDSRQTLSESFEIDFNQQRKSKPIETESVREESNPPCWVRSRSLSVGDRPMPAAAFIRL